MKNGLIKDMYEKPVMTICNISMDNRVVLEASVDGENWEFDPIIVNNNLNFVEETQEYVPIGE